MTRFAKIFARVHEQSGTWFRVSAILLVLSFLFAVAFGGVSHNVRWHINEINVRGAQAVDPLAVRAFALETIQGNYAFVYARDNSYLYPARGIESGLKEKFLRLGEVHTTRIDDHTIEIVVVERKPYGIWCGATFIAEASELAGCAFVDESGFVFDYAPIFSKGVYLEIYGALEGIKEGGVLGARLPEARFAFVQAFEKKVRAELGEVARMILKGEGEYGIMIRKSETYPILGGVEFRLKEEKSATTLMKNLRAALAAQFPEGVEQKKKLSYIDLRFGNKIFFGFEN